MNNLVQGKKFEWEVVIGLEIHAQVKSKSKLFSSSSTKFGSLPNSQVSLVDAAMPGMLPVINKYCIEQAVKTGIGLNAKINSEEKYVVMQAKYPSIYQQVMEKTKNLSYTTYVLADNLREFFTEAQQRAADEKLKRAADEQKLKEEAKAIALEEELKKRADLEEIARQKAAQPKSVWGKP